MSAPTDEITALREQVQTLTDRAEITDFINRFARELDERVLDPRRFDKDWAKSFFTEDAQTTYPVGSFEGLDAVTDGIGSAMSKFVATQHVHANHIVELDGDRATVRWDLLATHVLREDANTQPGDERSRFFTVGDYYEGEVVRTADGWRFRRMTLHVVWTKGKPPVSV